MKQLSQEQLKGLVARVTNMSTRGIEGTLTDWYLSNGAIIVWWKPNGRPELSLKRINYEDMYIGVPEGSMYG